MAPLTSAPESAPQDPCDQKRRDPNENKGNVDAVLVDQPIKPLKDRLEQLGGMLVHLSPPFIGGFRVGLRSWIRLLYRLRLPQQAGLRWQPASGSPCLHYTVSRTPPMAAVSPGPSSHTPDAPPCCWY